MWTKYNNNKKINMDLYLVFLRVRNSIIISVQGCTCQSSPGVHKIHCEHTGVQGACGTAKNADFSMRFSRKTEKIEINLLHNEYNEE